METDRRTRWGNGRLALSWIRKLQRGNKGTQACLSWRRLCPYTAWGGKMKPNYKMSSTSCILHCLLRIYVAAQISIYTRHVFVSVLYLYFEVGTHHMNDRTSFSIYLAIFFLVCWKFHFFYLFCCLLFEKELFVVNGKLMRKCHSNNVWWTGTV